MTYALKILITYLIYSIQLILAIVGEPVFWYLLYNIDNYPNISIYGIYISLNISLTLISLDNRCSTTIYINAIQ